MIPDDTLEKNGARHSYRVRHEHAVSSWRKWLDNISYLAASPTVLRVRPLLFAFSMCSGSIAYFYFPAEPRAEFVGIAAVIVLIPMCFALVRSGPALSLTALALMGVMAGIVASKVRTIRVDSHRVHELTGPVMVEGWVVSIEPASRGVRVRLNVHAVAGMAQRDMPQTIRLTHTARLAVAPGRFVRCWAVMRPPPGPALAGDYDFQRQAWFQGLDAVGYVRGRCRGGVLGEPGLSGNQRKLQLASWQRNLALYVKDAAGERAGGFAAALVAGDRSFMTEADRQGFAGIGARAYSGNIRFASGDCWRTGFLHVSTRPVFDRAIGFAHPGTKTSRCGRAHCLLRVSYIVGCQCLHPARVYYGSGCLRRHINRPPGN